MHCRLQRVLDLINRATDGMTDEELGWRPAEGKWCASQVLEHLSLAFSGTAAGFRRVYAAGVAESRPMTLKERVQILLVVEMGYFPRGREAPAMVVPKGIPGRQALSEIKENLAAMDQAITDCEAKFSLNSKVMVHPILGPLSLEQWRKFHLVHTRRHMKQIDELREKTKAKTA